MRARAHVCSFYFSFFIYFFIMIYISFCDLLNFVYKKFRMHSVSLAVSASELQMHDQSPLAHALPLPQSPLTSIHCSTDKTCSIHFKVVQDSLHSRLYGFLFFCIVLIHQPLNVTLAAPVIVKVHSFVWFDNIFSPSSFSCLQKLWPLRMISFTAVHYQYGVCFVMASNAIDSFANELSTCKLEKVFP